MTCILKSAGVQLAEWRASLEYLTSKSAEHRPQRGSKHLKQTALSLQFGDIYVLKWHLWEQFGLFL